MEKLIKWGVIIVALLAWLITCWIVGLYYFLSMFHTLLMFAGVLVLVWVLIRVRRIARRWWLRRTIATNVKASTYSSGRQSLDAAFAKGIRALRSVVRSRFGGIYEMPWVLMIGRSGSGKSTLLARTRLSSSLRLAAQGDSIQPTAVLDWWFFDRCVVLDPEGEIITPNGADDKDALSNGHRVSKLWQLLRRTRRREPLNAIVVALNVADLSNTSEQKMSEAGWQVRATIDELSRIFRARLPVYIVLTHCDVIPGFVEWGRALPKSVRNSVFGGVAGNEGGTSTAFLTQMLDGILARLAEIRLVEGAHTQPALPAFFLPEYIGQLRAPLSAYLSPAFDANPYSETPFLRGLFLAATVKSKRGLEEGWFSRALFRRLIPSDRSLYLPVAPLSYWRRFLYSSNVLVWLALCVGCLVLTLYSYVYVRDSVLLRGKERWPTSSEVGLGFVEDVALLNGVHSVLHRFDERDRIWLHRYLPFMQLLNKAADIDRRRYALLFKKHVLREGIDKIVRSRIEAVSQAGSDKQVAFYAQFLVRRIRMVDAAIAGESFDPLPKPDVSLILSDYALAHHALERYDPLVVVRFATQYEDYLRWQEDKGSFKRTREALYMDLDRLELGKRDQSWLVAWADLQNNLSELTLAQFWGIADSPSLPRVARAYTAKGHEVIAGFIDEVGLATKSMSAWHEHKQKFLKLYNEKQFEAWNRFVVDFDTARERFVSKSDWRDALSLLQGRNNPYFRLIHSIAETFSAPTGKTSMSWVEMAKRLDRLINAQAPVTIAMANSQTGSKLLSMLRLAGALGKNAVHSPDKADNTRLENSQIDLVLAQALAAYTTNIALSTNLLLNGGGSAYKEAAKAYTFGSDHSDETPIVSAKNTLDALLSARGVYHPEDWPVWLLMRGPVDFSVAYASKVSACALQQAWEKEVLMPLQGIDNQVQRAKLLFSSEKGLVSAFMAGQVRPFVNVDDRGYSSREWFGQHVGLNGQFFAFVNQAQSTQAALEQSLVDAAERKKKQVDAAFQRNAEIAEINAQITELNLKITQLQAASVSITLTAQPPELNHGAKTLPQQISLRLQCADESISLDNYNFPVSRTFLWSPTVCGSVSMTVYFPSVMMVKTWNGPNGFIDFLRDFRDGQYTMDVATYPDVDTAFSLARANVDYVNIRYKQHGQDTLLANYAALGEATLKLKTLTDRRSALLNINQSKDDTPDILVSPFTLPHKITTCDDEAASFRGL